MNDNLKAFIKSHRTLCIQYIVVILLIWSTSVYAPYISGLYIDCLVSGTTKTTFFTFIILIIAINILQLILKYLQSIVSTKVTQILVYYISDTAFQKIFLSQYSEYVNINAAYYIDLINKDSHTIVQFIVSNITNFIFQSATIIISGIIIFRADKLLCFIIFSLIPFYVITFLLNRNSMYKSRKEQKEKSNEYFSNYSEQINKFAYIKRNVLNHEMESRLFSAFNRMLNAALHTIKVNSLFTNLNQFVIIFAYVCIIGLGGYKVSIGALTIGFFPS